jgi:S-methylmethionine-dependent homocysteine/selenocysteine methylase
MGLILESATWRANSDWAAKLGYTETQLAEANRQAIALLHELRSKSSGAIPIVISGCLGPRGDGYNPERRMTLPEAQAYHLAQIQVFSEADVDMVTAITMNYVEEAIGITLAAKTTGLPVAISFTVETDGRLPTGQTLEEAIGMVDEKTGKTPVYYMVNCAHPTHFAHVVDAQATWAKRVRGIRVNASTKSHAELDQAQELDAGNPSELGQQCARLQNQWPSLNILGGCCGTDEQHIEEMCKAMRSIAEKR